MKKTTVEKESQETSKAQIQVKEYYPPGSAQNRVNDVLITKNSIYLATPQGVLEVDPLSHEVLNQSDPYLKDQNILQLGVGANGTLYANSEKRGLMALPLGATDFYSTDSTKMRDFFIPENTDNVYCATSHGIDVLKAGVWTNIKVKGTAEFQNQANDLQTIVGDKQGKLWIGSSFGLYIMQASGGFDFFYGNFQIIQGNTIINRKGNSPLSGNLIYDISIDPASNGVLIGTNGGATWISDSSKIRQMSNWKVFTADHTTSTMYAGQIQEREVPGNSPLPINFVKTVRAYSNQLYLGTESGLAHFYNGQWEVLDIDKGLSADSILSIKIYVRGTQPIVYLGTNGGITILPFHPTLKEKEGS